MALHLLFLMAESDSARKTMYVYNFWALGTLWGTCFEQICKNSSNSPTLIVFDSRIGFGTKNYVYTFILSSWDPLDDLFWHRFWCLSFSDAGLGWWGCRSILGTCWNRQGTDRNRKGICRNQSLKLNFDWYGSLFYEKCRWQVRIETRRVPKWAQTSSKGVILASFGSPKWTPNRHWTPT